jgi:GAG-pre-integrase domain
MHENSTWLGIDTLSTYCLTNDMADFVGKPTREATSIDGIGGKASSTITYVGRGTFRIVDDLGETCEIPVPNLCYCKTVPYKIISPQHLDKCWRELGIGTFGERTDATGTIIEWNVHDRITHTKTISHATRSGIPVCYTAPNYKRYKTFLRRREHDEDDRRLISCLSEALIPANEQILQVDTEGNVIKRTSDELIDTSVLQDEDKKKEEALRNQPLDFNVDELSGHVPPKADEFVELDAKAEKLLWHYRLGHAPFSAINRLSDKGELPKRLCKAADPICASCMFGQLTRQPRVSQKKCLEVGI